MTLSDLDTPWLLPTFSLLTATISDLIGPNKGKSFVEDIKLNILGFSPFRFGAIATAIVLELIGCRLLNLAEIHIILGLLEPDLHILGLERGFWSLFARRAFLIGITLPLYMMLLASASHRWIQVFATLIVAEAVLAETIFTFYRRTSVEVRRDWPRRVLLVRSDHLNDGHFENKSKPSEFEEKEEHEDIPPPSPLTDNLCDRVRQLWPSAAEPVTSGSRFLLLENTPELKRIFDPNVRAQWTCGHWRCLAYMVLHVAVLAVAKSWPIIELVSTTWLLHCELQPVTLQVAGKLSQSNLVYGLVSMLYQVGLLVLIVIFGVISAGLLLNRLIRPLFTRLFIRLSKQSHILQRMQQKIQDLAETAPITFQVLNVSRAVLCQITLCLYIGRPLLPLCEKFSQERFSYIIEFIAIPTIYVMVYWLVCIVIRTEQASPELGSRSNGGQSSEPNIATDSNCEDTQNPAGTDSRSTPSNEENKAPKDVSESSRPLKELRLNILRLSILAATATIWIFFFL
ncbi:hypothetical protein N7474_001629 [Penicillium riverlandense]|uniref:uncharacterized protein n=1 Tax=Penicillium riverlandense TaxID=1903569 RepID=UPI00254954B8|nr:uncharacterized protein N7474_001629 [Penicillium riverlandense]KAJ5833318.1 hypothetical protein N7474_001629 [Penicillium riverlandense]